MAQGGTIEYIGKIQLDASELAKMFGMSPGGKVMSGGGGGGDASSEEQQAKTIQKGMRKSFKDPSFMSIFRPLAALEGLKGLIQNSRVANAYLGAMGKMFSAAIDLLLLPFTPLFNLLMIGLAKLISWLIDSGVLEWMAKGVEDLIGVMQGAARTLAAIWGIIADIGGAIWRALPEPIRAGLEAIGKFIAKVADKLGIVDTAKRAGGVVAAAAGTAVLGQIGMGMIGLGGIGPLALGGRAIGGLFGGGGAGTAAQMAAGGGRGMMGRMGAGAMARFGGGSMGVGLAGGLAAGGGLLMGNTLGQQGGAMGAFGRIGGAGLTGAGLGAMVGGPWGAAIGGGIGLGIGGAAELGVPGATDVMGFLGMGKPKKGGGGGGGGGGSPQKVTNIGTQNVTMHIKVDDPKKVKEIVADMDEKSTQSSLEL